VVSEDVEPARVSIPPPVQIRVAAVIAALQTIGILVLASAVIVARHDADLKWSVVTAAYFLVVALLLAAVSRGLLRGHRWARTPAIVAELIVALVGFYLAVPSARPLPGGALVVVGATALALLLSRPANAWISRFPPLFGPAPDR
jgi:peptidoglycan/LPS O-acetylase OafA/YrhL